MVFTRVDESRVSRILCNTGFLPISNSPLKVDIPAFFSRVKGAWKIPYPPLKVPSSPPENQRMVSIHEAGHCAVAEVLRKGVVGLVSIHADEGFTQLDTPFTRRGQCVLLSLAGKVACELYESGRVASGCQSDLYKAFSLLQSGMEDNAINGVGLLSPKAIDETSEYLKARVENVVASELERYLYLCRDILIKNRDFVLALADELY